jgi:cell division GTPase FtsZ
MKLAVLGFGNAGGKIADALVDFEAGAGRDLCEFVLAINSATVDLERLERIPRANRLLIGQTDSRVKGRGVGSDPDLGAEIARDDMVEIERALDAMRLHEIDAFLLVAGLGGGTGSGAAPEAAERLKTEYEEPVYGLGVLPSTEEGGRPSLNAARSFPSFARATDNLILFDNDAWLRGGESIEAGYERANRELARRVVTLLAAGEIDGSQLSETAMDGSDVRRTLSTGGVSSVAFARSGVDERTRRNSGLLGRFRGDGDPGQRTATDAATKVQPLVRQAVQTRLTCPAAVDSAERSLVVVSGPPAELSEKGLRRARQWLESEIDSAEVLAGDDPRPGTGTVTAVVLLSNLTEIPRVDRLTERGVAAKDHIEENAASREADVEALLTDRENELDPV